MSNGRQSKEMLMDAVLWFFDLDSPVLAAADNDGCGACVGGVVADGYEGIKMPPPVRAGASSG